MKTVRQISSENSIKEGFIRKLIKEGVLNPEVQSINTSKVFLFHGNEYDKCIEAINLYKSGYRTDFIIQKMSNNNG